MLLFLGMHFKVDPPTPPKIKKNLDPKGICCRRKHQTHRSFFFLNLPLPVVCFLNYLLHWLLFVSFSHCCFNVPGILNCQVKKLARSLNKNHKPSSSNFAAICLGVRDEDDSIYSCVIQDYWYSLITVSVKYFIYILSFFKGTWNISRVILHCDSHSDYQLQRTFLKAFFLMICMFCCPLFIFFVVSFSEHHEKPFILCK